MRADAVVECYDGAPVVRERVFEDRTWDESGERLRLGRKLARQ